MQSCTFNGRKMKHANKLQHFTLQFKGISNLLAMPYLEIYFAVTCDAVITLVFPHSDIYPLFPSTCIQKKKRLVFYRNLHSASQWLRWNTVTALLRASGRPRIIKIEWNLSRGLVHAAMRNLWQWKSFKMLSLRAVALVRSLYGNAPITQAMAGL